jgi:hypothetical protein
MLDAKSLARIRLVVMIVSFVVLFNVLDDIDYDVAEEQEKE